MQTKHTKDIENSFRPSRVMTCSREEGYRHKRNNFKGTKKDRYGGKIAPINAI
jgi:hypothetical protein